MKYSLSEIKKKTAKVMDEFLVLDESLNDQSGWIGRNFQSHHMIGKALYFVDSWIKNIETNNTYMISGYGQTEDEMMNSYFSRTFLRHLEEINMEQTNVEANRLLINLLLDIGVTGMSEFVDKEYSLCSTDLFSECIKFGELEIFGGLVKNTGSISSENYLCVMRNQQMN